MMLSVKFTTKVILALFFTILLFNLSIPLSVFASEVAQHSGEVLVHDDHGHGMEPLLFIIIALIIGAATSHFLKKSPLPFTVTLLIIGLVLGVANRNSLFEGYLDSISHAIRWAGNIDPHIILFVFLPTLIFEAAFAMDFHTFKKTSSNAVIMAGPGILLALFLTAALMMGLAYFGFGLQYWNWSIALMFGAVVSATDPVAVVALLKELGASKKLGTLIEGESLLNDGTAIVIFMVFFLALTGAASDTAPVIEFLRVAAGGIFVGLLLGWIAIAWIKKVFNNAMVEISIIIATAYLTFYIAEDFLHVSGVLGLVALGLMIGGVGKTRISPEVQHFLHEFWELAAFIANALIFIIVGIVVAERAVFTATDFLVLGILYIGIHVVRAIVIAIFYPAMKRLGYGLPIKDAYVLWYGALRGAIGLALALVVAGVDDKYISPEIKNQFLFYTAGIVVLTLLINATTIKFLVNSLGLTAIPPAKALMMLNAKQYLRNSSENALERLKKDRFLSRANWSIVSEYLPDAIPLNQEKIVIETIAELRRRVLQKEKSNYWKQFKEGILGPDGVVLLSDGINEVMDAGGLVPLSERKDLEELWHTPKMMSRIQKLPILGKMSERMFIDKLSVSYDCARGFVEAQEECLTLVESMVRSAGDDKDELKNLSMIESEINENRIHGLTFLRNLRKEYPEIYTAIATRQASRLVLNYELHTIERLLNKGQLESDEAKKMIHAVEARMKKLMDSPPAVYLPENNELLKNIPWLKDLDDATFNEVATEFQSRLFAIGDVITKEAKGGDGLFVIARGTAKVTVGSQLVDVVGAGAVIGEISFLTGKNRSALVKAESPVTALRISYASLSRIVNKSPKVEEMLWMIGGARMAGNLLGQTEPFNIWRAKQLKKLIEKGYIVSGQKEKNITMKNKIGVLLSDKAFDANNKEITAPSIINSDITLSPNARIFLATLEEQGTEEQ
ncbi:MAG: cation:proton antiporter [Bacteroidetes bacterium]|nr:cation:proton antiporter [Bacteroidota bacterium]HET6244895.1 cation:proton antiporter [Bacteroidia bacterium]